MSRIQLLREALFREGPRDAENRAEAALVNGCRAQGGTEMRSRSISR